MVKPFIITLVILESVHRTTKKGAKTYHHFISLATANNAIKIFLDISNAQS
ncbi:hypothetical protein MTBBW1_250012 [Desulfamplus magnetovallimortis]|uniref:Uncharacterized protein n=1 Tax=Desulfamplus magnetovallimortis TaxID=1246637 RepID=A0A1W1HEB6_9BACT|nr:hypothetical protein MTBBW1_250012 [Desulfamplus magnetovallimortis]